MKGVRQPRIPERVVQSNCLNLARSIAGRVYTIGTTRRRGDYQGTMMAPGIADVYGFLPPPPLRPSVTKWTAFWLECKAEGGRLRDDQKEFQRLCELAGVDHIVGGVNEFTAYLITGGWLKADNVPHYRRPLSQGATV